MDSDLKLEYKIANSIAGETGQLDPLALGIVQTISYADIFDYPMTVEEIHRYLIGVQTDIGSVYEALRSTRIVPTTIEKQGDLYLLRGRDEIIDKRCRRAKTAMLKWTQINQFAPIIMNMPFVRMITVTGALALDNVEPAADLDLLIVTANGRLWLCRAFVLLVVHLAARSGIEICPNYLLAEKSIAIQERNLYTAHELAQMIPLFGMNIYNKMRKENRWVSDYLPNAVGPPRRLLRLSVPRNDNSSPGVIASTAKQSPAHARGSLRRFASRNDNIPWKSLTEAVLQKEPGSWLEKWEMNRKIQKFATQTNGNIESAFSADLCKGHFHNHALRALTEFKNRLSEHE